MKIRNCDNAIKSTRTAQSLLVCMSVILLLTPLAVLADCLTCTTRLCDPRSDITCKETCYNPPKPSCEGPSTSEDCKYSTNLVQITVEVWQWTKDQYGHCDGPVSVITNYTIYSQQCYTTNCPGV